MDCWHYGGSTEGDHGCWSEYCCNTSLSFSWCISLGSSWRTSFANLSYSQGEHEQHNSERAELLACSMNILVHLGIYKGEAHSEISAGTQGERFSGLCFLFTDLVHIQGEHALRGSITLCPWCQRGRVIWSCCHQVQRGRLLALWCMRCTWWQPTHRRTSHLHTFRWIYRRDIRCDLLHRCRTVQRNQIASS